MEKDFRDLFVDEAATTYKFPQRIQQGGWTGGVFKKSTRALCWRVLLGLLDNSSIQKWPEAFSTLEAEYEALKSRTMPNINTVEADPLSSPSRHQPSDKWSHYYKSLDASAFIKGDLERLYMNGIEDSYFHTAERQAMLLHVLFIWSSVHDNIGYRQGMHEIAGPILFVVEEECQAWEGIHSSEDTHITALQPKLLRKHTEAHVYWLFDRIMRELEILYDPTATSDGQPAVVHYCTVIQEHLLRAFDPELCTHLEEAYIQAQLYGMRWARLMLGREFSASETQLLRIWDYIFASCRVVEKSSHPLELETSWYAKARSGPSSPILDALGDFMLAMLLHIRNELIEQDSSGAMMMLMRYPPVSDVVPIVDLADMIRRGVLNAGAHIGPSSRNRTPSTSPVDIPAADPVPVSPAPKWLLGLGTTSQSTAWQGVGRRMSQTLSAVGSVFAAEQYGTSTGTGTPMRSTWRRSSSNGNSTLSKATSDPLSSPADGGGESSHSPVTTPDVSTIVSKHLLDIAAYLRHCDDMDVDDIDIPSVASRIETLSDVLLGRGTLDMYDEKFNGETIDFGKTKVTTFETSPASPISAPTTPLQAKKQTVPKKDILENTIFESKSPKKTSVFDNAASLESLL